MIREELLGIRFFIDHFYNVCSELCVSNTSRSEKFSFPMVDSIFLHLLSAKSDN